MHAQHLHLHLHLHLTYLTQAQGAGEGGSATHAVRGLLNVPLNLGVGYTYATYFASILIPYLQGGETFIMRGRETNSHSYESLLSSTFATTTVTSSCASRGRATSPCRAIDSTAGERRIGSCDSSLASSTRLLASACAA
jgi:hypothetical protein